MEDADSILIIESGSTKSDWVWVDKGNTQQFTTPGFNPFYQSSEQILSELQKNEALAQLSSFDGNIFFYGAGCSDEAHCEVVKNAFKTHFPQANIEIQHDLLAAARSCYKTEPVVIGILGTGSNCCFFNGETLVQETPSLGFLLGDEGSGSYIGKGFIASYLYGQVPLSIATKFNDQFNLSKTDILNQVYHTTKPNTYLAQFTAFLGACKNEEFVQDLVCDAFRQFVRNHVLAYKSHFPCKICFVGSVAFHFQNTLMEVIEEYGLEMGTINQSPLEGLVGYHLRE
ncbi:MAG: ATPase [Flavobacteriales bacterium]|nr:ATPase [Flavobacteriales bacterium]